MIPALFALLAWICCQIVVVADDEFKSDIGSRTETTFLYLVHSPICIPDMSHFITRRSDALLLLTQKFDVACPNAIYAVQQHDADEGNWMDARNILYREAEKLPYFNQISYIIMVDGLTHVHVVMDFGRSNGDALRTFEDYLLDWEPAVGVPSSESNTDLEVQSSFAYQHALVAYHVDAAPLLLPYWTSNADMDGRVIQWVIAWSAFSDHVIQFNSVEVISDKAATEAAPQDVLKSMLWAADSLRRLDDFLKLPWGMDLLRTANPTSPTRRFAGHQPYSITNDMGYFDECHPYFSHETSHTHLAWPSRRGLGWPDRFWTVFPARKDSRCGGQERLPYDRYHEKLLLFLQEAFYSMQAITAEAQGGPSPGHCPEQEPRPRLQISFPQSSEVYVESSVKGFHAAVIGLRRWDPFKPLAYCFALDTAVAQLVIYDVEEPALFVNSISISQSMRGWPPVAWYCSPSNPVGIREVKKNVVAIQPSSTYFLHIRAWRHCPASRQPWTFDCNVVESPQCDTPHEAQATSIFNVLFASVPGRTQVSQGGALEIGDSPTPGTRRKDFVYLVQSDVCLDLAHLKSDRSEVIQLNWKQRPGPDCPGVIYLPNSTLVQGRNRLVAEVAERFPTTWFRYHVVMDGDVTLVEVHDFGHNTGSAWLTWEEYLLEWEPAVGVPHFGSADYDDSLEVQLNFNFDQIVVAYHAEAVPLLLPYTEAFDSVSWWYCGSVQNALCAAVYNDHRLQFNALRALSWSNNPSPKYLRGSHFLTPLVWIAPAIRSLDALMSIPWYAPFHSALPSIWDGRLRRWVARGTPRPKSGPDSAVSYLIGADDGGLDLCHEYFVGRELGRLCERGTRPLEAGGEAAAGRSGAAFERSIAGHVQEIRRRLVGVSAELPRADAAGDGGSLAERARELDQKLSRLVEVVELIGRHGTAPL